MKKFEAKEIRQGRIDDARLATEEELCANSENKRLRSHWDSLLLYVCVCVCVRERDFA